MKALILTLTSTTCYILFSSISFAIPNLEEKPLQERIAEFNEKYKNNTGLQDAVKKTVQTANAFIGLDSSDENNLIKYASLNSGSSNSTGFPVPDVKDTTTRIKEFYEKYKYNKELRQAVNKTINVIGAFMALNPMPSDQNTVKNLMGNKAVVFDIDDTLVSTYNCNKENNFQYSADKFEKCIKQNKLPAIKPTVDLYHELREEGIKTFLVTGRPEHERADTIDNLKHAGINNWDGLYLKPENYNEESISTYKTQAREYITKKGNDIIMSVGDQWSDLKGKFTKATAKLPNEMYTIK